MNFFDNSIKPELDDGLHHLKQTLLQIRDNEHENILLSKAEYIELLISSFLLYSWTRDYNSCSIEKSESQEDIENYIVNFIETELN